jgi:NADH-quinone oxidoreductase subunit H
MITQVFMPAYSFPYDVVNSLLIQNDYISLNFLIFIILLLSISQLVTIIVAAGISSLVERKVFAAAQRRQGPAVTGFGGIYQFIADGVKLLLKEVLSPYPSTYFTFILAPMLIFVVAMLGWVFIPFDFGYVFVDLELNTLWSFTFSSLGVYGLILAGWSSNSKYSFLGSLRSAAQMVSYEVALGFIIICVALVSGSYNFTKIVLAQYTVWFVFGLWPIAVAFYISILAETNRAPFDLPEAEAELVAGYNLEYSAIPFALFFLGEYSSMSLMSSIFILFFLGGWLFCPNFVILYLKYFIHMFVLFMDMLFSHFEFILTFFYNIFYFFNFLCLELTSFGSLILAIKITTSIILFVLIRASYPRYRYDHLMSIGWKIFLPLTLGFVLFVSGILKTLDGLILVEVDTILF